VEGLPVSATDWVEWHRQYDDPESALSRRLRAVQEQVSSWLDETGGDPVKVVSVCAGEGRDLLEVLAGRGDAHRVTATLLDLDTDNVAVATRTAQACDLSRVTVRRADAGWSTCYVGLVPADLVLLCGVLGNIDDAAVQRVLAVLPQLCTPGGTVVWTRTREQPDLTVAIRRWLRQLRFEEVSFTAPDDVLFSVGRHVFRGASQPLVEDVRLFEFVR
jgi:hypothetical protein